MGRLSFTRREHESVICRFGDKEVKVTFLSYKGGRATLVFEAPRDVIIAREELMKEGFRRDIK